MCIKHDKRRAANFKSAQGTGKIVLRLSSRLQYLEPNIQLFSTKVFKRKLGAQPLLKGRVTSLFSW